MCRSTLQETLARQQSGIYPWNGISFRTTRGIFLRKVDPYYESLYCSSLKRVGLLDFLVFILSLSENNLSKWTWIIARRWEGMCRGFIGTTKCPRKSFLRIQSNQLLAFECVAVIPPSVMLFFQRKNATKNQTNCSLRPHTWDFFKCV